MRGLVIKMTLQQLKYALMVANTGSMNEAAKKLFVSQPSLSAAVKELESEMQISLFSRTSKGVHITPEGSEFLSYARQIMNQVDLLEDKFCNNQVIKKKFGVSTQHYSFAVKAFVEMVKSFSMEEYEFAIRETRTYDVIHDVSSGKSEIGILYLNEFNEKVLQKLLRNELLVFHELMQCRAYVYLHKDHPLSGKQSILLEELEPFPCLSFEQGEYNSFYFAEEVLSTYDYKKTIKACDRATMLNLMVGLSGYTLCSGIICEELNGGDYRAILLQTDTRMKIGYITLRSNVLSQIGQKYLEELMEYISLHNE